MARLARLTLQGYLHHTLQRGNNRQPIFVDDEDRVFLLALIADNAKKHQVDVHAYVLMPNHFHLLATPATADGVPLMMQAVGRRYVQYFNRRHGRTGTLWEGRYRSAVLDHRAYLLVCMAYLELNPVRNGVVATPADYPWSSYANNVGQRADPVVRPHPLYWSLGNTPFAREAAYAAMVQSGVGVSEQTALTASVVGGWALGDADFLRRLKTLTVRRVEPGLPGRPLTQEKIKSK